MNHYLSCIESKVLSATQFYGRFVLGYFPHGETLTVANTLRRSLLSQLSGVSISCVYIQGCTHEYQSLTGVQECALDILVHLKQIKFCGPTNFSPQIAFLNVSGPGIVKAKHLKLPYFIDLVDPEQYIAGLSEKGRLQMKLLICCGVGYLNLNPGSKRYEAYFRQLEQVQDVPKGMDIDGPETWPFDAPQPEDPDDPNTNLGLFQLARPRWYVAKPGYFPVNGVFSPVTKVNYTVEATTDKMEVIYLEVWTNGSVDPRRAIHRATRAILDLFLPWQTQANMSSLDTQPLEPDSTATESTTPVEAVASKGQIQVNNPNPPFNRADVFPQENNVSEKTQKPMSDFLTCYLGQQKLQNISADMQSAETLFDLLTELDTLANPIERAKLLDLNKRLQKSNGPNKASAQPNKSFTQANTAHNASTFFELASYTPLGQHFQRQNSVETSEPMENNLKTLAVDLVMVGLDLDIYVQLKTQRFDKVAQLMSLNPQALLTFGLSKNQIFRIYQQFKAWFLQI